MTSPKASSQQPLALNIFSLNCWGLKFISKHREERLTAISRRIAAASPAHDIVALQEFWVYNDYLTLRSITSSVLPYGKFYHSGVLGGGLVILSRFPIVGSSMFKYTLNGRPTAFWRGDWYVGKGVANAVIDLQDGRIVEVFNTHLHAPYEAGDDSYLCHRTAQAWEISKLMRGAVQKGHIPIGLGDFNMLPSSLAHHIVTSHGLVADSWLSKYPSTPTDPSVCYNAADNITKLGVTCDSVLNTMRLPEGVTRIPAGDSKDPRGKRLDYIFHSKRMSRVLDVKVGCVEPIKLRGPTRRPGGGVAHGGLISLSDHFSVELQLEIFPKREPPLIALGDGAPDPQDKAQEGHEEEFLPIDILEEIQALSRKYTKREEWEYTWRIMHFWLSVMLLVALHIGVWWVSEFGLAFLFAFLAWVVAVTGVVNGLIGFLFMGSELNALKEFDEEIRIYRRIAEDKYTRGQGRSRVSVSVSDSGISSAEQGIDAEYTVENVNVEQGRPAIGRV